MFTGARGESRGDGERIDLSLLRPFAAVSSSADSDCSQELAEKAEFLIPSSAFSALLLNPSADFGYSEVIKKAGLRSRLPDSTAA